MAPRSRQPCTSGRRSQRGKSVIGVAGGGAFGTALAVSYARHAPTVLWLRDKAAFVAMTQTRINQRYLPDVQLPD
ncbi:MAG: hypothetical protein AAF678_10115, partial [Pseudomonadota bacterium]